MRSVSTKLPLGMARFGALYRKAVIALARPGNYVFMRREAFGTRLG